jgi:hypothetical protein
MTTKNTDLVANFEAIPQVANNAAELAGVLRTAHGFVELAAGDSTDDDIVMLAPTASKKLWELAGDTSDPGGYYYVAITFNATGGTAGTLAWNINYIVN